MIFSSSSWLNGAENRSKVSRNCFSGWMDRSKLAREMRRKLSSARTIKGSNLTNFVWTSMWRSLVLFRARNCYFRLHISAIHRGLSDRSRPRSAWSAHAQSHVVESRWTGSAACYPDQYNRKARLLHPSVALRNLLPSPGVAVKVPTKDVPAVQTSARVDLCSYPVWPPTRSRQRNRQFCTGLPPSCSVPETAHPEIESHQASGKDSHVV